MVMVMVNMKQVVIRGSLRVNWRHLRPCWLERARQPRGVKLCQTIDTGKFHLADGDCYKIYLTLVTLIYKCFLLHSQISFIEVVVCAPFVWPSWRLPTRSESGEKLQFHYNIGCNFTYKFLD
jgi:hypothetical protein